MMQLYRHFDKDGALLYIGISKNARARRIQHGSSIWGKKIATMTTQEFGTLEEAKAAEQAAIQSERPLYNKLLNQRRCPMCRRLDGAHTKWCGLAPRA